MRRALTSIALLLRFVRAVVVSGVRTLGTILLSASAGNVPPAALVRMRFAPMNERGAALLGSMVSLTPGTTTINIDMERRELLLHVLDASDVDALVAGIRRDFESRLCVLFGPGGAR